MQESRIDDYWNIDGPRDLSDSWTGFTQFTQLEEKPPNGYIWSGARLQHPGQIVCARALDKIEKKCPAEGEAKMVRWRAETR